MNVYIRWASLYFELVHFISLSRHLYKMVDSCRQLTVSQSNGDEDTAGMVTILTGHQVEELCTRSAAMKVRDCFQFCLSGIRMFNTSTLPTKTRTDFNSCLIFLNIKSWTIKFSPPKSALVKGYSVLFIYEC